MFNPPAVHTASNVNQTYHKLVTIKEFRFNQNKYITIFITITMIITIIITMIITITMTMIITIFMTIIIIITITIID